MNNDINTIIKLVNNRLKHHQLVANDQLKKILIQKGVVFKQTKSVQQKYINKTYSKSNSQLRNLINNQLIKETKFFIQKEVIQERRIKPYRQILELNKRKNVKQRVKRILDNKKKILSSNKIRKVSLFQRPKLFQKLEQYPKIIHSKIQNISENNQIKALHLINQLQSQKLSYLYRQKADMSDYKVDNYVRNLSAIQISNLLNKQLKRVQNKNNKIKQIKKLLPTQKYKLN